MSILTLSSLVFIIFSFFVSETLSAIFKLTSLIFIMSSTVVFSRYLSCTYSYILNDEDFIITKETRAGSQVICKLYYTAINDVVPKNEYKKGNTNVQKLNYCSTMFCKNCYYIVYDDGTDSGIIAFEPDAFFVKALEKRIKNDIILP